jgi:hypothetical protein
MPVANRVPKASQVEYELYDGTKGSATQVIQFLKDQGITDATEHSLYVAHGEGTFFVPGEHFIIYRYNNADRVLLRNYVVYVEDGLVRQGLDVGFRKTWQVEDA